MTGGRTGGLPGGVHTTYNRMRCGRLTIGTVRTTLVPASIESFEVLIVANPNNTDLVWVGEQFDGCHIPLDAGASVTWPINDVQKIYVRANSGTQQVHWAAGVKSA